MMINQKVYLDTKVEIQGRQALWRIEYLCDLLVKSSDYFKIGVDWKLNIVNLGNSISVRLYPKSDDMPVFARFSLRVAIPNRKDISTFHERVLRTSNDFVVTIDPHGLPSRFDIVVEFSEIKIPAPDGGEDISVLPIDERMVRHASTRNSRKCFSRVLKESLLTDVTINTMDDTKLHAHRAVLSASSPIFHSMFTHDIKQLSTIDMVDMTSASCMTLLSYMYGTINKDDFWKHRMPLLVAAKKYSIPDLEDACEESLLEDINLDNVLERLQEARLHQLTKLKKGCMTYLLDSGKIYHLGEGMSDLFRSGDRELLEEIYQGLLASKRQS